MFPTTTNIVMYNVLTKQVKRLKSNNLLLSSSWFKSIWSYRSVDYGFITIFYQISSGKYGQMTEMVNFLTFEDISVFDFPLNDSLLIMFIQKNWNESRKFPEEKIETYANNTYSSYVK